MSQKKKQVKNNDSKTAVFVAIGIAVLFLIIVGAIVISALSTRSVPDTKVSSDDTAKISDFKESDQPTNFVKIDVQGHGSMIVELYPDVAPITVENFKKLVSEHFYDGVSFHRIYKEFMIQGGDPDGDGYGGSKDTIKGEFSSNGVINDLSHTRGVISMARSNDKNSASSQFFIVHSDKYKSSLDGNYAAFGKLVAGYLTLDSIANVAVKANAQGEMSVPLSPVIMDKVTFVKKK